MTFTVIEPREGIRLYCGDCLEVLPTLAENSVDSIVTDPPYGLEFMGKEWDKFDNSKRRVKGTGGTEAPFGHHAVQVDADRNAGYGEWCRTWAVAALRVAKPGAMLMAFGGTRTWHRLACAIEDAGWEIRDTVMWVYGSGFPKSHDISKAIDKAAGAMREVVGAPYRAGLQSRGREDMIRGAFAAGLPEADKWIRATAPSTPAAQQWDGWGTALKPAWEPILLAMKPLDGTFAENAQKWGVAGLWIDGGRLPTNGETVTINTWDDGSKPFGGGAGHPFTGRQESGGRWPANLIHDGSDEVLAGFPNATAGGRIRTKTNDSAIFGGGHRPDMVGRVEGYGDTGSAARFFYCAKASRAEREAGLEGARVQLRTDLTAEQRAYVMVELERLGVGR